MKESDVLIRKMLRDVFEYIGGIDAKYAGDATVRTYAERLIKKANEAQSQRIAELEASNTSLRSDLIEIADGCGVGVPEQGEAKRRIIAIASRLTEAEKLLDKCGQLLVGHHDSSYRPGISGERCSVCTKSGQYPNDIFGKLQAFKKKKGE